MEARARTVSDILHESAQYMVPLFQRSYSWHKENWQRLHDDIVALADESDDSVHFLGPLVCTKGSSVPGDIPVYQLIDGQQRLTTLSVLLASIRDVARSRGVNDLAEEISEDYLIHKRRQGLERFKVLPRLGDRDALQAIVESRDVSPYAHLRIVQAWKYFRRQVTHRVRRDPAAELKRLFNIVTRRLSLVVVSIDGENPYEIFESLNATGLPLAESDLIRNYIFMQVPVDKQADFDRGQWSGVEQQFAGWGDAASSVMTGFYRDYLMRDGAYSRDKNTFLDFKRQQKERGLDAEKQTKELRHFAPLAAQIRKPDRCDSLVIRQSLSDIALMDIGTSYALILNLMNRRSKGLLSEADLAACLRDLVSFVLRRTVCGESTRPYGRWFVEAIGAIGSSPESDLKQYWLERGWPDDSAFKRSLLDFRFYSREPQKAKMVLLALERSLGHKERVDLNELTIEHVMPQTVTNDKAGRAWKEVLGCNWEENHERYLHTLGNLTLTGYNPELGKMSFCEKQAVYKASHVDLNRHFNGMATWNCDTIRDRAKALADVLCQLWPRPDGAQAYVGALDDVPDPAETSPARRRNLEYWGTFLKRWDKTLGITQPDVSETGELLISLDARAGVSIALWQFRREKKVVAYVRFVNRIGRALYAHLRENAEETDGKIEGDLIWDWPLQNCFAVCEEDADFADKADWEIQYAWFYDELKDIVEAIRPEIAQFTEKDDDSGGDPERHKLRYSFWAGLLAYAATQTSLHSARTPCTSNWIGGGIGRNGFSLNYGVREQESQAEIYIDMGKGSESDNDRAFLSLQSQKDTIEAAFGGALDWQRLPDKRACRICKTVAGGWRSPAESWPETHAALTDAMIRLDRALRPYVQGLKL